MDTRILVSRWEDGTFSIHIGASEAGIIDDIEAIADPQLAEVRVLPVNLRAGWLVFDQEKKGGDFSLQVGESGDIENELWAKCKKVVWPSADYPLTENLKARIEHCAGDGLKQADA